MKLFLICARDYDKHSHTSALSLTSISWGGSWLSFPWHRREMEAKRSLSILPKSPQLIKQKSPIWTQALEVKSLGSGHWQYPINGLAFITVTVEPTYMVAQLLHFAVEESGKRFHNQPVCEGDWSYYQGKEWAPGQLWEPVCRTLCLGSETELPAGVHWETKTTGPVVLNKKLKITKGAC